MKKRDKDDKLIWISETIKRDSKGNIITYTFVR